MSWDGSSVSGCHLNGALGQVDQRGHKGVFVCAASRVDTLHLHCFQDRVSSLGTLFLDGILPFFIVSTLNITLLHAIRNRHRDLNRFQHPAPLSLRQGAGAAREGGREQGAEAGRTGAAASREEREEGKTRHPEPQQGEDGERKGRKEEMSKRTESTKKRSMKLSSE